VDANSRLASLRRTGEPNRAARARTSPGRKVLVVDVDGTSIKILATGHHELRSFASGRTLTPRRMVSGVKKLARDWAYDAVSIGYPGPVLHGRPIAEPHNLGRGWVGFDFTAAFGHPAKVINDAAMQALGSYFADRLYPGALDAVRHVQRWGPAVILSDGDAVYWMIVC
jgi:hypothetical protein